MSKTEKIIKNTFLALSAFVLMGQAMAQSAKQKTNPDSVAQTATSVSTTRQPKKHHHKDEVPMDKIVRAMATPYDIQFGKIEGMPDMYSQAIEVGKNEAIRFRFDGEKLFAQEQKIDEIKHAGSDKPIMETEINIETYARMGANVQRFPEAISKALAEYGANSNTIDYVSQSPVLQVKKGFQPVKNP